jgi:hypothetical protein
MIEEQGIDGLKNFYSMDYLLITKKIIYKEQLW